MGIYHSTELNHEMKSTKAAFFLVIMMKKYNYKKNKNWKKWKNFNFNVRDAYAGHHDSTHHIFID